MFKNNSKNKILKQTISAVILFADNSDKKLLEAAKNSVNWCSEILFINGKKGSFSDWRNEGLKKAKGDWILYLDSDEEITESLKKEIQLLITNYESPNTAFAIPRKNIILGKEFKYSGQYPDYQKRLFKKEMLVKWVGHIHEEPVFKGSMEHLKSPIIHHKNMTLSQMIVKTNIWSEIEADLMFKINHPPMNILRFISAGAREFFLRFVKEKAFLDGKEGIIYGIYQIYSKLISYAKLWEKQQSIIHI